MNYKHIIFDIDGTLIDTEKVNIKALQDTLIEIENRKIDLEDLKFSAGIPGEVALSKLGIKDLQAANLIWNKYAKAYYHTVTIFDGIKPLLETLKNENYRLGIITSKNKTEYKNDFLPFGLSGYFETVICVEDALHPKPSPYPMQKYLEITGANKTEVIYIGDSIYDMQCASSAGVDCGLALWGCDSENHIYATHYFSRPQDVLYTLHINKNTI